MTTAEWLPGPPISVMTPPARLSNRSQECVVSATTRMSPGLSVFSASAREEATWTRPDTTPGDPVMPATKRRARVAGRFRIDNFGGLVDARPGGFRPDLEHEDTALVNGKLEIDARQRGGSGVSGGDGDCLSRQLPRLGRGQGEALRIRLRSATAHGALPRRIVGLGDRLAAKTSLHNRQADRVHQK